MRILVVEDDVVLQGVMQRSLADAGHRVDAVSTAQQANHLWRVQPYDTVLLDLNLPDIDGREVLRLLKSDPELCSIPVIVMTTSVDDNDVAASYRMHANGFVSKAPDYDALVATLAAIQSFWLTVARLPTD